MNELEKPCNGEILVVDDTPANLKLLMELLIAEGYKVRPATDGEQALESVAMRMPELILLDIKMPGIDGYEVCQRLKQNKDTRDIPVIFISALDALDDRVKGFELGGVDYITKPFQREEVLIRARTHLQLYRMQVNLEALVQTRTSELQKANEELHKSQTSLEDAQRIGHLGNWEWDIVSNELHWSEELYRIFGLDSENFGETYDAFLALVHPDDRESVQRAVNESQEPPEGLYNLEHRILRADGTERVIQTRGEVDFDQAGRPFHMIGTALDITERRQAEAAEHRLMEQRRDTLLQTIQAIALTVEKRDPYTSGHQERVADLAATIATELGLDETRVEGVRLGGLIHDIGKISIPAEILNRPGALADAEFTIVKTHAQAGYEIVKGIDFPWPVSEMILQHHERLDGSGYPDGLKSGEIILEARIMTVADTVEAMVSHRPYRPALSVDEAMDEITKQRGRLYDPDVVDCCVTLFTKKDYSFETKMPH
jgi:putative nucleotidyltransferase with HDIG domain/PAS domain S-box-containing protein